jgi:galactose oxidase
VPPRPLHVISAESGKVPSVAHIIQITASAAAATQIATETTAHIAAARSASAVSRSPAQQISTSLEKDAAIQQTENKPAVVVGITPTCPYGLSSCWSGAYEALKHLNGIKLVRPVPNAEDSTGFVYLKHDGLPDLDAWPAEFASIANGVHRFRGVEVTLKDVLETRPGNALVMHGNDIRPPLLLEPIQAGDKIQWDVAKASAKPLEPDEQDAYQRLQQKVDDAGGSLSAEVTGPIVKSGAGYVLKVRQFAVSAPVSH